MSKFVRCVDNTLQRDVLVEGKVYERVGEIRDGYVNIEGLGRFSAIRFVPIEGGYQEETFRSGIFPCLDTSRVNLHE